MNIKHTFVVLAYKESKYLECCVQSVKNQEFASEVVIATSTPNEFIDNLAKKYDIKVVINPEIGRGIGCDFDFAVRCVEKGLVTVAHQDDIYDPTYSLEIAKAYQQDPKALIIFSDYYEIRNKKKVYSNTNLKIKDFYWFPYLSP